MACDDPRCAVCSWQQQAGTRVQQVLPAVRREAFPSLSLMSKPITPALPRLRWFPNYANSGNGRWRCRVEVSDIARRKGVACLSIADYHAPNSEGWGDTKERAYRAWESKWRSLNEPKYQK